MAERSRGTIRKARPDNPGTSNAARRRLLGTPGPTGLLVLANGEDRRAPSHRHFDTVCPAYDSAGHSAPPQSGEAAWDTGTRRRQAIRNDTLENPRLSCASVG